MSYNKRPIKEELIRQNSSENIANLQPSFLEKLIQTATNESVEQMFSKLLVEDEKSKQSKVSGKIDKLGLRAEKDDETVQDEQEEDFFSISTIKHQF